MKKTYINRRGAWCWSILFFIGCAHPPQPADTPIPGTETIIDSSLVRLLQPVNRQVIADISTIKPVAGTRILSHKIQGSVHYDTRNTQGVSSRVSGRIERLLIKYNYQPVKKGERIMEVYSPELAAAQQELLFVSGEEKNEELFQKAIQKLKLLGMQETEIRRLLQTRKVNYRIPLYSPAGGFILEGPVAARGEGQIAAPEDELITDPMDGSTAASPGRQRSGNGIRIKEGAYVNAGEQLFTIYDHSSLVAEFYLPPALAAMVKKGQSFIYSVSGDPEDTSDPENIYRGTISLVQPTLSEGSNFTLIRAYVKNPRLLYGQLITARIPVIYKGWWLPQAAVLNLGNRQMVFRKENGTYHPQEVKVKAITEGMALIDDAAAGWEVAANAAFLVDSESLTDLKSDADEKAKNNE